MIILGAFIQAAFGTWNGLLYAHSHSALNLFAAVICAVGTLYSLAVAVK